VAVEAINEDSETTSAPRAYVSVREIWSQFKGRTELQASAFVKQHLGSWSRAALTLVNVAQSQVVGRVASIEDSGRTVVLFFDSEWQERLLTLSVGSQIMGDGQIQKVTSQVIYLRHCEFEAFFL
jgi:hypothetical protein